MNLEDVFEYEPDTGKLLWRISRGRAKAGTEVGWLTEHGYRRVIIGGKGKMIHRIIWDMNNLEKLKDNEDIDHINHVKDDNRLSNLRKVTRAENNKNRPKSRHNTSGQLGVYWDKSRNKWAAQIKVNGRQVYLGRFDSKREAINVRHVAEAKYDFHANHGAD